MSSKGRSHNLPSFTINGETSIVGTDCCSLRTPRLNVTCSDTKEHIESLDQKKYKIVSTEDFLGCVAFIMKRCRDMFVFDEISRSTPNLKEYLSKSKKFKQYIHLFDPKDLELGYDDFSQLYDKSWCWIIRCRDTEPNIGVRLSSAINEFISTLK